MATQKKELTVEEKLKALYDLQQKLSEIDAIKTLRGELPQEVQDLEDEIAGLHTRVALCGGAGGFLIDKAVEMGAQLYVTADMRYHDFLDNSKRIVVADIGHYESEHFTKEIFLEIIQKKSPTFAVAFSKNETNQVNYL